MQFLRSSHRGSCQPIRHHSRRGVGGCVLLTTMTSMTIMTIMTNMVTIMVLAMTNMTSMMTSIVHGQNRVVAAFPDHVGHVGHTGSQQPRRITQIRKHR